jgi:hypothetical protein
MAKFKHTNGEIDIDKKVLAAYSDEQLTDFAASNQIDAEDIPKLKEKIGAVNEEEGPKLTTGNTVSKPKKR